MKNRSRSAFYSNNEIELSCRPQAKHATSKVHSTQSPEAPELDELLSLAVLMSFLKLAQFQFLLRDLIAGYRQFGTSSRAISSAVVFAS